MPSVIDKSKSKKMTSSSKELALLNGDLRILETNNHCLRAVNNAGWFNIYIYISLVILKLATLVV